MTKTKKGCLMAVLALCCMGTLASCGGGSAPASSSEEQKNVLKAPTNFTFDTTTGDFSFTANDANAGYYFVRCFSVVNGAEASTYTVSSKRISGGDTGAKSGNLDVSGFGWGDYNVKLITYAAAGTDYQAPDAVVLKAQYGVGGILEKPEMAIFTEGNLAEVVIDWYTLNDYYAYQFLPELELNFYSDEALTTVVKTDKVDLHDLLSTIDVHPAGGNIWGYVNAENSLHAPLNGQYGFKNDLYEYTLDAGEYWVTAKALSTSETTFSSSKVSDVVHITMTADAPTGATFETCKTDLYENPSTLGVPVAMTNHDNSSRVDYAGSQTTTSRIAD